jgi:UMF1 family MFS transporter
MTSAAVSSDFDQIDERTYKRRIWAWTMYDWGNSAFATTILAAILPAYYSSVAGATLPSEATATAYWSLGLSFSLFVIALLSPILGTISDIKRNKKPFLAVFTGAGVITTGLLVLVGTGDWLLASLLFVFGRIGFTGANVFYDALLPHVAKESEQDEVSTRGYAMGYLGGGLLLAINIVMMQVIPDSLFEFAGIRLSFLSVAIWWGVFTIPLLRTIPEPPAATAILKPGETVVGVSFRRVMDTFRDVQQYRELFKYLVSFLIYNDGIGTIIGVAVIYGAELGFGTTELVLALLLVQFAGIPFSLIFGRLPSPSEKRRPLFLAFIIFNLIALPVTGILARSALALDVSGAPPTPYEATDTAVGEGVYTIDDAVIQYDGSWESSVIAGNDLVGEGFLGSITTLLSGTPDDVMYDITGEADARYEVTFNGQEIVLTYSIGPDGGLWDVLLDGEAYIPEDEEEALVIDSYNTTTRYGVTKTIMAAEPGEHTLAVINTGTADPDSTGTADPDSTGTQMTLARVEVREPIRQSNLGMIIGMLAAVEVVGAVFALLAGRALFTSLANTLDTRRSVLLALLVYSIIAIWGYFLNSTVEFWFLAWMVSIVQGGSQALSRSLYASMSPAAKSGEFFGLYGIMEKFSAIIGPLLFAAAATIFGSSRPAILSLIALFIIGGYLLTRVDVAEGRRVAQAEDAVVLGKASS